MAHIDFDLTADNAANPNTPQSVVLAVVVNPDGTPVSGGGGGGSSGGLTDAQLRATPVPVSGPATNAELRATALPVTGPITNAQLTAVTGAATAAAWDGVAASATVIQLLKALYAQNVTMIAHLAAIEANTAPPAP